MSGKISTFQETLNAGKFVFLLEHASPGMDTDPFAAGDRLLEFESLLSGNESMYSALAITDAWKYPDAWRAVEHAAALPVERRSRHVIYLSGRNTSDDKLDALLESVSRERFSNIVPVSGDLVPLRGREQHTESTELLRRLQRLEFGSGAVVNPYEYSPYALFTQYYKMIKKCRLGASFLVAQCGWDMLKLQSLFQYLSFRSVYVPVVARLMLLTPEAVERIVAGQVPGITISPEFRSMLNKELSCSQTQFEAAQWRRLELQAAGCRLLGASGIQLAGIESPAKLKIAMSRIEAALDEFKSFEQWQTEYASYLSRSDLMSFPRGFHLFGRELRNPTDPLPRMAEYRQSAMGAVPWQMHKLRRFFFHQADKLDYRHHFVLKWLLAGCKSCGKCRLPKSFYLCPAHDCPKNLSDGPCGGVRTDGRCENGEKECMFSRMMRLAECENRISVLEDLD